MKRRMVSVIGTTSLLLILSGGLGVAQQLQPIMLPAPQTTGGKPVMEALSLRATSRSFASTELSMQTLSNLLWAAWGINRSDAERHGGGKGLRTAPSASDWQETDVYVVMQQGSYVYDATTNSLKPVVSGDYRGLTGTQLFVKDAPVTLVFVADKSKMKNARSMAEHMMWADAAFVSENVYIFAASEGLATGVRASIDRSALGNALKLSPDQEITLAQCVGFPK